MNISSNIPRDFNELVEAYQRRFNINIEEIIKDGLPVELLEIQPQNKANSLILKSLLWLNIQMYNNLLDEETTDEHISYLQKLLIYDYFDFYQAYNSLRGIQLFSVARSVIDHSRIILLCLYDLEFLDYYFKEYTFDEKKERYYQKRETKISSKLNMLALQAKELNNDNDFFAESAIYNLTTELYAELTDKLGEITHMSEITNIKKFILIEQPISFCSSNSWQYNKLLDCIIEYLILTTLVTEIIYISEDIKLSQEEHKIYNFLNYISESLYKFRNIDRLLDELHKQLCNIFTSENKDTPSKTEL